MSVVAEEEVSIKTEGDVVAVRRKVRQVAVQAGFGITDVTRIVTAASEMARNIYKYAGAGLMHWRILEETNRRGVELEFIDHGPGIPDVSMALQEGYTTGEGLGLGLPGTKRLMDELEIHSVVGEGTTITIKKWRAT